MTPSLNIAHRGGAQLWPENTLFAFACAANAGYDGAELDVQLSRDGELVVFHDFALKAGLCRDQNGRWIGRREDVLIRDLSFAALRTFDVGRPRPRTLYARRHRHVVPRDGERMPSLSEAIAVVRHVAHFRLFVELKIGSSPRAPSASAEALAEAVVRELRDADFLDRAILVGFDWRGLIHAKAIEPAVTCWFSTRARTRVSPRAIRRAGADGWFCPLVRASASAVGRAQALGLRVGVWTVDSPRDMRLLLSLGVDAICTDRPDRLKHVMDGNGTVGMLDANH
jgi:glycerophosphoryl diester phosphodiesterase